MPLCLAVNRFENQIVAHEQRGVQTGNVLLYGSSFFANWGYERARQQWSEASGGLLQVVNHGFGGATVDELLYYYARMVKPYTPAVVVLRTGFNDVMLGLRPEEVWFLTERLLSWLRTDFSDVRIVLLENFDGKLPDDVQTELIRDYNRFMCAFAEETEHVYYLSMNSFVYQRNEDIGTRKNFRDIFVSDGIHLTDDAYAEMAKYMVPKILEMVKDF